MAFLQETDYDVQLRGEIAQIIDTTTDRSKLAKAEGMAIKQMRNYIAGHYDVDKIFAPAVEGGADTRDAFIIMTAIDIALYHLWSKEGGHNIPKIRELRYNDALEWLKAVQGGAPADLPPIINQETQEAEATVRIWSLHPRENQRY